MGTELDESSARAGGCAGAVCRCGRLKLYSGVLSCALSCSVVCSAECPAGPGGPVGHGPGHTEARRRHKERRNGGTHGSAHSPVLPSCSSCLRYARPEGPRGLLQRAHLFLLLRFSRITAEPSTEGGLCGLYDRREFCQMRLEQQEQQEQRGQQAELTESMHMINAWFEACGHLSRQPVSSRRSSISYLHPASNSWPGRAQDGMA